MNVLVIGSGGREHALVWKLRQSPRLKALYCAPGNPGIGEIAECIPIPMTDLHGLLEFARRQNIDLTVVGPEQPLALGIVDLFDQYRLRIFGPSRDASQLEWSKAYAKSFMQRHGIPTARYQAFSQGERELASSYVRSVSYPAVIKADGLAAGKGVVICEDLASALAALGSLMRGEGTEDTVGRIVIEEYMVGEEASVFAVCDGVHYATLAPAQDHKRVFDGDLGRNTGGMGAYAPAHVVTQGIMELVRRSIIEPTLQGMAAEGRPYKGCLYIGLMVTSEGPKVVEYNSRFGDPETQVVLPLYSADILELMMTACDGTIGAMSPVPDVCRGSAVCVVLASGGYPDAYETGKAIRGLETLSGLDRVVAFHAGTRNDHGALVTSGGRVLGLTAWTDSDDLGRTIGLAYEGVRRVSFEGMHFRKDIGAKALVRSRATPAETRTRER